MNYNLSPKNIPLNLTFVGISASYNKTNYTAGLDLEYEFNDRFSLNSGIAYINNNYTGSFDCQFCFPGTDTQSKLAILFRYIEVPISGRYYIKYNKFRFFTDIGLKAHQIVKNKFREPNIFEFPATTKYFMSVKLGLGTEYNLNKKIAIQLIPEYTKGMTDLIKERDYKPSALSLKLGIAKRF